MVRDAFYPLKPGSIKLSEDNIFDQKIRTITKGLLTTLDYKSLADFYREKKNQFAAGEFWGKIMRASAWIYSYTGDKMLMKKMRIAVNDMLSIQGADGEISTAPKAEQPNGSSGADLWERKYVMLGMLGYYSLTKDKRVKDAMIKLLDYTIEQVGEGKGQMSILDTGWAFYAIESSSILEPVVKIYNISHDPRHLEFAKYIVESGGCKKENIFKSILNGKSPRFIGDCGDPSKSIAKAYEMMSCFEGLTEYYRVTGNEDDRKAVNQLYRKLIEEEITFLGSGGADAPFNLGPGTGEQWNFTKYEQANPNIDLMMETCVTVTWMKLNLQLLRLEGNSTFADSMEISAYNVLIAALRPDGMFFEYFPRFGGTRNPKVNFSYNVGGFDLSCCTANGPMGLGAIPQMCFMNSKTGPVINFYMNGSADFGKIALSLKSDFPKTGHTEITVTANSGFKGGIVLRVPEYAKRFTVLVNGEKKTASKSRKYSGYRVLRGEFPAGTVIDVDFKIEDKILVTEGSIEPSANGKMVLMHGPVALSRDARNTDIKAPVAYSDKPSFRPSKDTTGELLNFRYDGFKWIDYQSAGATWDEKSEFATFACRK